MPVDTDDAIHAIHRSLQSSHECTVHELGKNFYRNYAEYVKVAQEAEKFENDLIMMRAMVSQLKGFSNYITGTRDIYDKNNVIVEEATPVLNTPQTQSDNLSIAESIQNDPELDAKLKRITDLLPDAMKFVSETKSVLLESSTMALYLDKQWKPAQVWLLSNGILIASRKAKVSLTQGVRHKLTFERFYQIDGLLLSNVNNTADLQNCFKVKNSDLGSVFLHTEDEDAKNVWMQQIQKAIQDQQDQKTKSPSILSKFVKSEAATTSAPSSNRAHRRTSSACTSGTNTRPSLYIESFFDHQELSPDAANNFEKTLEDFAEALSCTNYDLSLDLVEKCNNCTQNTLLFNQCFYLLVRFDFDKINFTSPLVNSFKTKFELLKNQLASFLFIEISDPLINQTKMVDHVQKLIILGFVEEARERFLISRSEVIKTKTSKVQYYGDVFASVALLSSITFESIETAFTWFNESFEDAKLMSAFVSWARNEISRFCDIFGRQALRRDLSMEIVAECIQDALNKCRALGQCGLDLSIFLEELLGETLKEALKSRAALYLLNVDEALQKDSFEITIAFDRPDWPKDLFPPKETYKATESLVQLVQSIESYLKDVLPLMKTPQMTSFCVTSVYNFINSFAEKFLQSFYVSNRTNTQLCHIAADVEVISKVLLPRLVEKFPTNSSSLMDLHNRLINTSEALYTILAEIIAKSIVPSEFSIYSQIQSSGTSISNWVERSIPILAKLSRDSSDSHRNITIDQCIFKMFSILQSSITEQLIKFPNSESLHQFNLDLKFLLHLTENMTTAETIHLYDQIFDTITKGSVNDLDRPLPSSSQIDNEIAEIEKLFTEFKIDFN